MIDSFLISSNNVTPQFRSLPRNLYGERSRRVESGRQDICISNAQRSRCVDDPYDELGDGSGCEPVMNTDSDRGVWFPPRPREGGTPTSRVGGGVADADCAASSASMTCSTSSMQISTFSGLRSCAQIYQHPIVGKHGHGRHLYE